MVSSYYVAEHCRTKVSIILVQVTIFCSRIDDPANCGGVLESFASEVHLAYVPLKFCNAYDRLGYGSLDISKAYAAAAKGHIIIGGGIGCPASYPLHRDKSRCNSSPFSQGV